MRNILVTISVLSTIGAGLFYISWLVDPSLKCRVDQVECEFSIEKDILKLRFQEF